MLAHHLQRVWLSRLLALDKLPIPAPAAQRVALGHRCNWFVAPLAVGGFGLITHKSVARIKRRAPLLALPHHALPH